MLIIFGIPHELAVFYRPLPGIIVNRPAIRCSHQDNALNNNDRLETSNKPPTSRVI